MVARERRVRSVDAAAKWLRDLMIYAISVAARAGFTWFSIFTLERVLPLRARVVSFLPACYRS
jgi:hypothetical protein